MDGGGFKPFTICTINHKDWERIFIKEEEWKMKEKERENY